MLFQSAATSARTATPVLGDLSSGDKSEISGAVCEHARVSGEPGHARLASFDGLVPHLIPAGPKKPDRPVP